MEPPTGFIHWFSKTEGNTYASLLHHPFLFKGKPTLCSRGITSFSSFHAESLVSNYSLVLASECRKSMAMFLRHCIDCVPSLLSVFVPSQ